MTDVNTGAAEAVGSAMADPISTPDFEAPKNGHTKQPSVGKPASTVLKELMSISGGDDSSEGEKSEAKPAVSTPDAKGVATLPAAGSGVVRAKHNGEELEIPEDATFTIKVDGKEVEVTYKDLQRNYQGKVPWERHYKETKDLEKRVKEERTQTQAEINKIRAERDQEQSFIKGIMETVGKDPFDALVQIAIRQGKNPVEFIPQYIQQAQATIQQIAELDENQFNLLLQQKKLAYDEKLFESKSKKAEEESKQKNDLAELQGYLDQRIAHFKITPEEFESAQATLQKAIQDGYDVSKLNHKQLADLVVGYVVQFIRPEARIETVIKEHAPSLASDKKFISELRHHISDANGNILPDYSDDDIAQIVKGFLGGTEETAPEPAKPEPEKEVLGAKPAKDSSRNSPTPATFRKTPRKKDDTRAIVAEGDEDDPLSFDDILKGYRK